MARKSRKAPSAAQLRARAAFAARGRAMRSRRGAVSFGGGYHRKSSFASSVTSKIDWLEAILFGAFGYLLGPTLSSLGVGNVLMQNKWWAQFINAGWNASADTGGQAAWGYGGISAVAKIGGVGLLGKQAYDLAKGKPLSKGDVSAVIPLALGMILDPPSSSMNSGSMGSGSGSNW